jgi:hypothetical protein
MFNSESKTTGREQVDVTGLIGQYAHGNEPSHHMAYLYNYIGKPEKTSEKVHYILNNFYKNTPDGLIGNEDCGQMSAWYVLSSMGMYSVTPGLDRFDLTKGIYDKAVIDYGTNKKVLGLNNSGDFKIIPTPIKSYSLITPVPVIQAESKSFKDRMKVEVKSQNPNDNIYYKINNYVETLEKKSFELYNQPFEIQQNATISAYVINNNLQSNTISAQFFKKPNNFTIDIKSTYNPQYHAGGKDGLLDGIFGTTNWRKGDWQGYQSQDFEAVIDMQKETIIYSIDATFLQDSRSWILMPTKIEYYVSTDNVNFILVGTVENDINPKETENKIKNFILSKEIIAKFVKVKAYNFGKLPEWHQGFGGDAFIFVDEITIK